LFIFEGGKKQNCQRIAHDKYNLLLDVTNDNKMEVNADDITLLYRWQRETERIHYYIEKDFS